MKLEVGSSLTTPKSGVVGVIKEVISNKTGSKRVRLELPNGTTRWTTIKQSIVVQWVGQNPTHYARLILTHKPTTKGNKWQEAKR